MIVTIGLQALVGWLLPDKKARKYQTVYLFLLERRVNKLVIRDVVVIKQPMDE